MSWQAPSRPMPPAPSASRLRALGLAAVALPLAVGADPWPALAIPPENARSLRAPPRRPRPGDIAVRARWLVDALRTGEAADLQRAEGFFLPREPFLAIKDMSGAAGYFATLLRWYRRDITGRARATTRLGGRPLRGLRSLPGVHLR